jgi:heme exporter protein D
MKFFRMRLIVALVIGVTLVSIASTYLEVVTHKHFLRQELKRRTAWQSKSLQAAMEKSLAAGQVAGTAAEAVQLRAQNEALGLAVYDLQGKLVTAAGPAWNLGALPRGPLDKAIQQGADSSIFGHRNNQQWLEEVTPLHADGRMNGAMVILEDANAIHAEGVVALVAELLAYGRFVLLIVCVTLLMVRWFLMRPMMRVVTDRLRRLRMGNRLRMRTKSGGT